MSFARLPVLRHGPMVRDEEILPDSAMAGRLAKVRQLMERRKVDTLLLYSDATRSGPACYLTNYPCFGLGRRATVVLTLKEGPFLFTAEPSRNLPRVRRFTVCEIEKTRQFLSAACERAKYLSGGSPVGLVNLSNLPFGLIKDTKELSGVGSEDMTREFSSLLASKDEGGLKATQRAVELAERGLGLLAERASSGKDLWQLAAYLDYKLRLLGCEDTNILLGCSARGRARPGYPACIRPSVGGTLVAYVAVQYARLWGAVGTTLSVGSYHKKLNKSLTDLWAIQKTFSSRARAGMTLGEVAAVLSEIGHKAGMPLAEDLPHVSGIGFDPVEYPACADDRLEEDMVLQVTFATDVDEEFTAMVIRILRITGSGSVWLTGDSWMY